MAWEVIGNGGKRGAQRGSYAIRISRQNGGKGKPKDKLAFIFLPEILKLMRWTVKDRIRVLVDNDRKVFGLMRTMESPSYTLSHNGEKRAAKTAGGTIRIGAEKKLIDMAVGQEPRLLTMNDFSIEDDVIVIPMLTK